MGQMSKINIGNMGKNGQEVQNGQEEQNGQGRQGLQEGAIAKEKGAIPIPNC